MDLTLLIEALCDGAAYPHPVQHVQVCHTHISVVFLAGSYAYKIKKPVNLGFLDFTTQAKRRHFCEEEVRLNRRLAADVYQGVVPVTRAGDRISMDGAGEVVEWAVKMQRLPGETTLVHRLKRGEIDPDIVETLAQRIAAFHATADAGPQVAAFGAFEVVAANARENFVQAAAQVGTTVSPAVFQKVSSLTETALNQQRSLIDARAKRGVPRDTHGDLHLDHVYLFPKRPPPADLVVIDCIEFNERFRFADPVADMAFLVMDFAFHGRRDLAIVFADAYFRETGDAEGRALLSFYTTYRAVVRGKVDGLKLAETEIPAVERTRALAQARAHWLLALAELAEPDHRPCLVLVGGLPGSGKSTLARALAQRAGFSVIRSDVVRKELAGLVQCDASPQSTDTGIYTPAWSERTYTECLWRAEALVFAGERVIVDATFWQERWRAAFLDAATRWGVQGVLFCCHANPQIVRERLANRKNDVSDADWAVHLHAAKHWEEIAPVTTLAARSIATDDQPEQALTQALDSLRSLGLVH
jgi:uncharacterized protein